jgi:hypothetical protein
MNRCTTGWLLGAWAISACVDTREAVVNTGGLDVDTHDAIVSTAAIASDPWTCPRGKTRVTEVSYARYRLQGCGQTAVYDCNYAFNPPRCWK